MSATLFAAVVGLVAAFAGALFGRAQIGELLEGSEAHLAGPVHKLGTLLLAGAYANLGWGAYTVVRAALNASGDQADDVVATAITDLGSAIFFAGALAALAYGLAVLVAWTAGDEPRDDGPPTSG